MNIWPAPTPAASPPPRLEGHPHSADVFVFMPGARWLRGSFQYADVAPAGDADVAGNEGSWEINGETIAADQVTHWIPLPPDP